MAIVYLRAGYSPDDYLDDSYWAGRLTIERSNAVKCARLPALQLRHELQAACAQNACVCALPPGKQ